LYAGRPARDRARPKTLSARENYALSYKTELERELLITQVSRERKEKRTETEISRSCRHRLREIKCELPQNLELTDQAFCSKYICQCYPAAKNSGRVILMTFLEVGRSQHVCLSCLNLDRCALRLAQTYPHFYLAYKIHKLQVLTSSISRQQGSAYPFPQNKSRIILGQGHEADNTNRCFRLGGICGWRTPLAPPTDIVYPPAKHPRSLARIVKYPKNINHSLLLGLTQITFAKPIYSAPPPRLA